MKNTIDILPHEHQLILQILQAYLPQQTSVWAFGSRVTGKAKKFSDLDLAIDANGKPLSLEMTAKLANAFDESILPYKVDIVDWNTISISFKKNIQHDRLSLGPNKTLAIPPK